MGEAPWRPALSCHPIMDAHRAPKPSMTRPARASASHWRGSGPLGAIYEIGALCALDESLTGLQLTDYHGYVGVSAGGFIAASLANGISPRELYRAFIENQGAADDILHPGSLMRPAWGEFVGRLAKIRAQVAQAAWRYTFGGRSLFSAFERLGRALPTGLFSNRLLEEQMRPVFSAPGRSNDLRQLRRKLVLVATMPIRLTASILLTCSQDSALCLLALAAILVPSSAMLPSLRHFISRASTGTCTNRVSICGSKRRRKVAMLSWAACVLAEMKRKASESRQARSILPLVCTPVAYP